MAINNRIEWIDVAKGIGIILVIAGHTIALVYSYPIYSFHMPLFFLLSGMFVNTSLVKSDYLCKVTRQLIYPWAWMLTTSGIVCLLIPEWRSEISIKAIARDFYSADTNVFQNSSLWFLVCLWVVNIIFFYIDKLKRHTVNYKILFYIFFCFFAIGILWIDKILSVFGQYVPHSGGRLPLKLDTAFVCLIFFSVGCWHKQNFKNGDFLTKWYITIPIIIIWCGIAWQDKWINLNALLFGQIKLLFYFVTFLGIFGVIGISKIVSQSSLFWLKQLLSFYGRNSLIIFGFQSLFIRLYILIANHASGLNMQLYANNPIEHQIGSFVIVAFVISPVLAIIYENRTKLIWEKK